MSRPIAISNVDVSPLSLAASSDSPASTASSFSHLSLASGTTLVEPHHDDQDDSRSSIVSLSLSPSSSSSLDCDDCGFPCRPDSDDDDDDDNDDEASSVDSCTDPACCPLPAPKAGPPVVYPESSFTNLVIVGAGPHSLALAARLSEPRPAALYTDLEHARLNWLQREQQQQHGASGNGTGNGKRKKTVKGHWSARKVVPPATVTLAPADTDVDADADADDARGIRVLDSSSDQWMARWKGFFTGLKISTLRSPMLFHPSPADVDALVAYARRVGGENELEPIHGVVGKELSKHQKKKKRTQKVVNGTIPINERDRQDYFRPSTRLFNAFIASDLVARYSLENLVTHSTVTSVVYTDIHLEGRARSDSFKGFVVESRNPDGSTAVHTAKAVVVAPGPSNVPNIPQVIRDALPPPALAPSKGRRRPGGQSGTRGDGPWDPNTIRGDSWCHSSAFSLAGFSPLEGTRLGDKVRRGLGGTVLVIGGGLTSVQIIDSLLAQGVTKIHLVCRSYIKIKHFDFPLCWVSKYNNLEKASFWNAPTHSDRLDMIRHARDGGSVNPQFYKLLNDHVKAGRVELRTLATVSRAEYVDRDGAPAWEVAGETRVDPRSRRDKGRSEPGADADGAWSVAGIDYVVASTGSRIDLDALPFLSALRTTHPPRAGPGEGAGAGEVGGLPCLTGDLQWNPDVPLFMLGAYAMLELGPDALNLSGTRTGAERVAHRLGQLGVFDTVRRKDVVDGEGEQHARRLVGRGTRGGTQPTRMEEKQHRSGGEGNFFRGLSIGVEA